MSKLLINEQPLVILPSLAVKIGLSEAIFLQQVHYWLQINKQAEKNYKEGKYWTYNTFEQWNEQLPFFSVRTLKRIVGKLKIEGLLITGNFNKNSYDRTLWYSINYEKLNQLEAKIDNEKVINSKMPKGHKTKCQDDTKHSANLARPIPETKKENIKEILRSPVNKSNNKTKQKPLSSKSFINNIKILKDNINMSNNIYKEEKPFADQSNKTLQYDLPP